MNRRLVLCLLVATASGILAGCSKTEETAPEAGTAQVEISATNAPTTETTLPEPAANPTAALAESRKAIEKKDYETAADAFIRAELAAKPATQQQSFDQINYMRDLSQKIADAAATGDPRAVRAAELMRRYQQMRMMVPNR